MKKAADEELMNFDDDDGNGWDDEDADWGDLEDGKYLTNSVQQLFKLRLEWRSQSSLS